MRDQSQVLQSAGQQGALLEATTGLGMTREAYHVELDRIELVIERVLGIGHTSEPTSPETKQGGTLNDLFGAVGSLDRVLTRLRACADVLERL